MRHDWGVLISVWIPKTIKTGATSDLAPGTAIVTDDSEDHGTRVKGWFEGNIYAAENLSRFADRALLAAGRMRSAYPTRAVREFLPTELLFVGHLDEESGELHLDPSASEPLSAWLAVAPEQLHQQLLATSMKQVMHRELRSMDPVRREILRRMGPVSLRSDT